MPEDIKTYSYLSLYKEIGGHRQVWSRMSKSKMYKNLFNFLPNKKKFTLTKTPEETKQIYIDYIAMNRKKAAELGRKSMKNPGRKKKVDYNG